MMKLNQDVLRMELQISELIRIVANLNDRLRYLEEIEADKFYINIQRPREEQCKKRLPRKSKS